MNSPEIWKEIPEFNGQYIISNYGRVASKMLNGEYKGRKLNLCTGYSSFSVSKPNQERQGCLYVHRVVASVFLGTRPTGMVIRHLDGNKRNNNVENLKYGYPQENTDDTKTHGCHKGIRNGRSKLDEKDVKAIKSLLRDNVSLSALARAFNVSIPTINLIDKNKNWCHIS